MENWQPIVKDVNERDLVIKNNRGISSLPPIVTKAYCSEGDTLYINQKDWSGDIQRISLMRDEFYNLIFNFMSGTELLKLTEKRLELEFKNKS